MAIEPVGFGAAALVILMAVVTLATRWGGVFLMGFVPIKPSVERFINGMSGSVLVAILAPLAVEGDWGRAPLWRQQQRSCWPSRGLCQQLRQAS
jgi:branched-subunit amino acid transport protein